MAVSKRRIKMKLIGLFTIVSVVLFVAFLSILLSDKIFVKKNNLFVLYFSEPIRNLNIGSPVVFRGVEVGKVAKINLVVDKNDLSFTIPVYINLNIDGVFNTIDNERIENKELFVKRLIEKGLKGKLDTHSIITGQLMIELEILPDEETKYRDKFTDDDGIVEIPTILSSKKQLTEGLKELPVKEIFEKVDLLLSNINNYVPAIMENAANFISEFNNYNQKTNSLPELIENTNKTINNIGEAAKSLHNFLDYLERNPESLIKGKSNY